METITKEQQEVILDELASVMRALGFGERQRRSDKALQAQSLFIIGVSAGLSSVGKQIPPYWTLCSMSQRSLLQEREISKAKPSRSIIEQNEEPVGNPLL